MLTRIELTNFMSHTATVIEPAPGLTVLVGPNNCGKSAVVAALQLLCQNPEAKFAVRHGAKECVVKVQTDDGHTIVWRRKTAASYDLDGERFDRLGRGGIPEKLHELLRLPVVGDEAGADFDIHFGSQKSPIFLLDSSSATAARFFASSSDAIRLVEMQRRHKEKLADKQRNKRDLEAESVRLTSELERLEPVVELDRRLQETAQQHASLLRAAEWHEQAQRDVAALAAQAQVAAVQHDRHAALGPLAPPPHLPDPRPLQQLGEDLAGAARALERCENQAQALHELPSPPALYDIANLSRTCAVLQEQTHVAHWTAARRTAVLPLPAPPLLADIAGLARLLDQLADAESQLSAVSSRAAALQRLAVPPSQADAASLATTIAKLAQAQTQDRRERARLAAVAQLAPAQTIADPHPLRDCVGQLTTAAARVAEAEQQSQQAAQQLTAARAEFTAFAATEVCPTCGSPLDAEKLLARAAVGLGGHAHG